MAGESKLQSKARVWLTKRGWLVTKMNLASRPGWPDTEIIRDGRTVRIEFKDNKALKAHQVYIFKMIREHGGEVYKVGTWEEFLALGLE
jgi:hypothetical protein